MTGLFLAYDAADEVLVQRITNDLQQLGVQIRDMPDDAAAILLVISPQAMTAQWQNDARLLIPVVARPAEVDAWLYGLQYVDFYDQRYDVAFDQLHNVLAARGLVHALPASGLRSALPVLGAPAKNQQVVLGAVVVVVVALALLAVAAFVLSGGGNNKDQELGEPMPRAELIALIQARVAAGVEDVEAYRVFLDDSASVDCDWPFNRPPQIELSRADRHAYWSDVVQVAINANQGLENLERAMAQWDTYCEGGPGGETVAFSFEFIQAEAGLLALTDEVAALAAGPTDEDPLDEAAVRAALAERLALLDPLQDTMVAAWSAAIAGSPQQAASCVLGTWPAAFELTPIQRAQLARAPRPELSRAIELQQKALEDAAIARILFERDCPDRLPMSADQGRHYAGQASVQLAEAQALLASSLPAVE